jgi:signal transduction histidine kinase
VDAQARHCEHCGIDLAIAAVLAEREIFPAMLPVGMAVTPEILVPRLGEYLVEKGHLAPSDLEIALQYQRDRATANKPLLLGQALLELGMIKSEVLGQAITEQILQLHLALKRANEELEARIRERTIELQRAIEKLGELSQLKANFIASVSHELRTPLTHIKGYIDLLLEGHLGPVLEGQREALRVINRAEVRLEGLIEDLIHFSLFSRGEITLNQIPTRLVEIIEILVAQVEPRAHSAGIDLVCDVQQDLTYVFCDVEKITWVITHLLDNAVKFTPRGGQVKLMASQSDNFVKISVSDTGIGIPSERVAEIFEPFHQLDGSPTRRYGGTGIGLALSQQILVAHGSTIEVESRAGKGSRFAFRLPVVESRT